jgi:hypothetical protein
MGWTSWGWFLAKVRDFLFSKCPDELWSPLSLLFSGYWPFLCSTWSTWAVKFTTNLHVMLCMRVNGAIHLLPLYSFVVCRGTTERFTKYSRICLIQKLILQKSRSSPESSPRLSVQLPLYPLTPFPTPTTSSAVKTPYPQYPGHSACLV